MEKKTNAIANLTTSSGTTKPRAAKCHLPSPKTIIHLHLHLLLESIHHPTQKSGILNFAGSDVVHNVSVINRLWGALTEGLSIGQFDQSSWFMALCTQTVLL